jgi:hypothetical protein
MAAVPDQSAPGGGVTPSTVDMRAVARVASRVALRAVRLSYVQAAVLIDVDDIPPGWGTSAFIAFDSHGAQVSEDGATVVATCSFIAVYVPGADPEHGDFPELSDDRPPAVDVEATFELVYDIGDPSALEAGDIDHFALVNASFNAWPYWRELAQNATMRMGLTPLVVGTYKIPSIYDPPKDGPTAN